MPVSGVRKSCAMASSITDLNCSLCRTVSIFAARSIALARSIAAASKLPKAPIVSLQTGGPDMPTRPIMFAPIRNGANQVLLCASAGSSLPLAATFKRVSSIRGTPVPAR